MGKGKPIYSGNVLGNRVGEKKGFRKNFTHVEGKQTKEERQKREMELQSLRGDFQKHFQLAYCRMKDIS